MSRIIVIALLGLTVHFVQSVRVVVDTSKAPELYDFGVKTKKILEKWYPYLNYLLQSPKNREVDQIYVYFDPHYKGVAQALASSKKITGNPDYFRRHQDDFGAMIHEMTHVIQNYHRNCDGWVVEGIADWVRYFHYEPQLKKAKKPDASKHYTNGYGVTAYFLDWINKNKYKHMTYFLNKNCRDGTYNVNVFRKLTGKTVDQLWQEMLRDNRG